MFQLSSIDKFKAMTFLNFSGAKISNVIIELLYGWFQKNGNCQKKFCQILLNFYSLKRPFRI
jgi:hypothetical protein